MDEAHPLTLRANGGRGQVRAKHAARHRRRSVKHEAEPIEDGVAAFNTWTAAQHGDAKLLAEPPVVGLLRAFAAKYPCKG
jgi:hypothetical protein